MTDTSPRVPRGPLRSRWLPWTLFGVAAFVALILLVTTAAVASAKAVPVAGPTITATATVAAAPRPAKTVTVADDSTADALRTQLKACDAAWREVASGESDALTLYNNSVQSIVNGVQTGDTSSIDEATDSINQASSIVDGLTPKVPAAHAVCVVE